MKTVSQTISKKVLIFAEFLQTALLNFCYIFKFKSLGSTILWEFELVAGGGFEPPTFGL